MNPMQRIVLAIYCFLLAYCCIWIPWRVTFTGSGVGHSVLYSFVWAVPDGGYAPGYTVAVPEMHLIFLRVLALTAVAGGAFIITSAFKSTALRG